MAAISSASTFNSAVSFIAGTIVFSSILYIIVDYLRVLHLRSYMPPGPFPLPVFGNYFAIPKEKPWYKFAEWSEYYNDPLITLWNGHRPNIICNDCWSISDLLEKRASNYSSRPRLIVMGEVTGAAETNQVCQIYGERWKTHRKLMVRDITNKAYLVNN